MTELVFVRHAPTSWSGALATGVPVEQVAFLEPGDVRCDASRRHR